MKHNNLKKELVEVIKELLTTTCVYKNIGRSAWICGFGKGVVAHIEDHRNSLEIKTEYLFDKVGLVGFIGNLIDYRSRSLRYIDDYIVVRKCTSDDGYDIYLEKIIKQKLYFQCEVYDYLSDVDIQQSIDKYYKNMVLRNQEIFGL